VRVCAADGGVDDLDDGVGCVFDFWDWFVFERDLTVTFIHEGSHCCGVLADNYVIAVFEFVFTVNEKETLGQ
jgi:hypothetical protein